MNLDDLGIPPSKIDGSTRRLFERAEEETRRLSQNFICNEHLFVAFAQLEWETFAALMANFKLNPNAILQSAEKYLQRRNPSPQTEQHALNLMKLTLRLALQKANRMNRSTIESFDVFAAVLDSNEELSAFIFRNKNFSSDDFLSWIYERRKEQALKEERLKNKFKMPSTLSSFGTNLNLLAAMDKLLPVYGRDKEIQQALEVLSHKERPNSVMLLGEAGVGKTAIVEGLARRIELEPNTIPVRLRNCQIVNIQINSLVAGTTLRGMFEERIQNVIRELKEMPNLILFVDEAHTLIGAGSAHGASSDAANTLKSVLTRGEIRMIAATTLSEYKQRIEEDEALARRFRTVMVSEPNLDETRVILNNIRHRMGKNYLVELTDEAIEIVLELSPRYQRHLRLPDKPISWLDTAAVRTELAGRSKVNTSDVIDVVANVTGLPPDMIFRDVGNRFNDIEDILGKRVIGQSQAIRSVANRLRLSKGPLKDNFDRPDGVLFFLGPTGVGKTELAKALAEFLFGSDKKMIRLDMSEYQGGDISIGKLIGTPGGIIGSERGGVLTNQLKDNPYSVVLLDEIEKATQEVLNLFLQAFDEGWLTNGRGKRVYLSDSIVIMTSNIGSRHFRKLTNPMGFQPDALVIPSGVVGEVKKDFERHFSPEFRNRIDEVVIFDPLTCDHVRTIAIKEIDKIRSALTKLGKILDISDEVLEKLIQLGFSYQYGARFLKRVIEEKIKVPISGRINNQVFKFIVRNEVVELLDQDQLARV